MKPENYTLMQLKEILQDVAESQLPNKHDLIRALQTVISVRCLENFSPEMMDYNTEANHLTDELIKQTPRTLERWIDCFVEQELHPPLALLHALYEKREVESQKLLQRLMQEENK